MEIVYMNQSNKIYPTVIYIYHFGCVCMYIPFSKPHVLIHKCH